MPNRRALGFAASFLLLSATACSGGTALRPDSADQFAVALHSTLPGGRTASGFGLEVRPECLSVGRPDAASASFALREVSSPGGLTLELLATQARGLKAAYCRLDFDPARWALAAAEDQPLLAPRERLLALSAAAQPGELWYGQVIARAQEARGFSGAGVLARFHFVAAASVPERRVLAAPVSTASAAVLNFDGQTLSWGYAHQGDYDQNSETNIADLTPISLHYQEASGGGPFDPATAQSVIDGDSNGEIFIPDLTPIGLNFSRRVGAYNIYASLDPGTDFPPSPGAPSSITPLGSVDFTAATGNATLERKQFSFELSAPQEGAVYWVRPADGSSEGTPSNQVSSDNIPPQINSLTADPDLIGSLGSSTITADATDANGDTLTYNWTATTGAIVGAGAVVTYNAPDLPVQTLVTIGLTVEDGQGGSDTATTQLTVDPASVNHAPVINSISCDPDPVPMGTDADLSADVTDIDGDTLDYQWEVSIGSVVATPQGDAVFTAPTVGADTTATITLTVDDGNGGTDSDSIDVTVQFIVELLDHIEMNDLDPLPGSGTELDPYLIDGDPGSEFEVQFKAVGSLGNDITNLVAWGESSTAPGTGFSVSTQGLLFVSPFDDTFEVNAILDTETAPSIYFKVIPPS